MGLAGGGLALTDINDVSYIKRVYYVTYLSDIAYINYAYYVPYIIDG